MSYVVVHRPARARHPLPDSADLVVATPPQLPTPSALSGPMAYIPYLLPAVASLGAILFMLANPRPLFVVAGILFAVSAIAVGAGIVLQQRSAAAGQRRHSRVRYLEYLDGLRVRLHGIGEEQVADGRARNPEPEALWQLAQMPTRLWERRRHDPDFLRARVGTGTVALAARPRLDSASSPLADLDPVCVTEAERLVKTLALIPEQPLTVRLADAGVVSVVGLRTPARCMVRALVAQVAAWHAPDDLRIAVAVSRETAQEWTWTKWLPHLSHPGLADTTGPARLFSGDPDELRSLLLPEIEARQRLRARATATSTDSVGGGHILIVVDRADRLPAIGDHQLDSYLADPRGLGVTVVHLVEDIEVEPSHVDVRLRVAPDRTLRIEAGSERGAAGSAADGTPRAGDGRADRLEVAEAEAFARRLAPLRLSPESAAGTAPPDAGPVETLGFDAETLDPATAWRGRPESEWLRVPVGVAPDGQILQLDLKESALGGMGPHGILVGATGSGKSELLRTLVVSLVATHPPDRLNLVLVDFKGGATFAGLAELPHVAGMITNLEDDLDLVDRMHDALRGEITRRQELLRAAGDFASAREYETARTGGADLPALPSLFVIVDEFSELLAARPDFIDMFVAIGRVGRSLGVHLLLASQRLEEGRLRGLESHLRYRIGLRTFSAIESRTVLGVPDAYELPPVPGIGYLKVDTSVFQRFRGTYVSGPLRSEHAEPSPAAGPARPGILPFTASNLLPPEAASRPFAPPEPGRDEPTVLSAVVARLRDAAPRAHQVWLPPLDLPPTLDHLLPDVDIDPRRGLRSQQWSGEGQLRAPVGVVDRPRAQAIDPLVVDLSGSGGNLGVVGGPRSGKSTLIRTLIGAFALTHTPDEARFYCLDLGGGGLTTLTAFPHVGEVATRLEPELVRRLVTEMTTFLEERERGFRAAGVDSAATMRAARGTGRLPDGMDSDVFLVIDGWAGFRRDFEDLEPLVIDLAQRGLGYGIHVVVAAGRWFDIKPALKDTLGTRLELRIGEPIESEIDRKEAAKVPTDRAGRGLTAEGSHCQIALPRIDGRQTEGGLGEALADFAEKAGAAWNKPAAPRIRVLPSRVLAADLPAPGTDEPPGVPIGVGEPDLAATYLDMTGADPHFLVYGDGQSGKTTFLRTFLAGLTARQRPDQARVVLVDYRRTLLDAAPDTHAIAYAGSANALDPIVADLVRALTARLPGPNLTAAELRDRSWWDGPKLYLVIDDHDLTVTPTSNPLLPLVDLLPQGRDIGFHVVLARRVGGASRAAYEGVLQRLKDLGTPGLILSGDRAEGPLIGPHRAAEQPPGRGLLVSRSTRPRLVQIAIVPEPVDSPRE